MSRAARTPRSVTRMACIAYYRVQRNAFTQLSPDVQRIANPGYNRDRGPATVYGLRVNLRY